MEMNLLNGKQGINPIKKRVYLFLKWLEKLLTLDTVYFAKSGLYSFIQQTLGLLAGLFTSYLFGHFVSKNDYGQYNLILSILSLLTIISIPQLDVALTQSIAKGYEGSLRQVLKVRFFASLLAIPILIIASIYYAITNYPVSTALLITIPFFPLLFSLQSYQAFLTGKKRFDLIATFSGISSLCYVIFILVVILLKMPFLFLVLAYVFSFILPATVGLIYAKKIAKNNRVDKELIPYGFFLTLNSALAWVGGNFGNIILGTIVGTGELAIFSVASRLPTALQKSYANLSKPITAKIAGQTPQNHREIIFRHGWKLVVLGFGMFISVWFFLPFFVYFFFPSGYNEAVGYGRWLSTIFIPMPLAWALSDIAIFQKNKRAQIFINIVPSIFKIIAYILLIPTWKTGALVAITVFDDYVNFLLYLLSFFLSLRR